MATRKATRATKGASAQSHPRTPFNKTKIVTPTASNALGILASVIKANRARFAPEPCIAYNCRVSKDFPAEAIIVGLQVLDPALHDPKEMGDYWDTYAVAVLLSDDVEPGKLALVELPDNTLELGTWNGPESFSPRGKAESLFGGFELLGRVVYASFSHTVAGERKRARKAKLQQRKGVAA